MMTRIIDPHKEIERLEAELKVTEDVFIRYYIMTNDCSSSDAIVKMGRLKDGLLSTKGYNIE